jgi:hypothetical protein
MEARRSFICVITVLVTSLAAPAWAQGNNSVIVVIHDSAAVPPEILDAARAFAAAVFERAAVTVHWDANGGLGTACRPDRSQSVDDRFCVQVLLRARNSAWTPAQRRVMGMALAADNRRAVLSVYFDAVTDVARRYGVSPGQVLGIALAHEMGHVLLPPPSHSPNGIMQPSWEGDDLRHVITGNASFTSDQAAAMRGRLAHRKALAP